VPLPEEVYRVLVEVVEAMREGKVITLVPRTQRLTTQEAADFLGVSRPTMVKLLEDGKIPYEQPGRHRRILFTDLLAYTERQHADRRAALDRMTEEASEAGIYGGTPEDYATALKKARRRAARPRRLPAASATSSVQWFRPIPIVFYRISERINEHRSRRLIRGFGVQGPGGAPGLTWGFTHFLSVLPTCLLHVCSGARTQQSGACQKRPIWRRVRPRSG
jgi:excisionase family DNA binding protein